MDDVVEGFFITGGLAVGIIFLGSGDINFTIFLIGGIFGAIFYPRFIKKNT
jgi:hypothetical protein